MVIKKHFGKRIQEIRQARGLTQEQLAEKMNKSSGTIVKIENGHRFPTYNTLEELKDALGVSYADLFSFDKGVEIRKDDNLIYEISSLSPKGKEIVYKFVKKVLKDIENI